MGNKLLSQVVFSCIALNSILFLFVFITHHYPPVLTMLHVLSLIVLCSVVINKNLIALIRTKRNEIFLILGLILFAFLIRIYQLEEIPPGMYGDELMTV